MNIGRRRLIAENNVLPVHWRADRRIHSSPYCILEASFAAIVEDFYTLICALRP